MKKTGWAEKKNICVPSTQAVSKSIKNNMHKLAHKSTQAGVHVHIHHMHAHTKYKATTSKMCQWTKHSTWLMTRSICTCTISGKVVFRKSTTPSNELHCNISSLWLTSSISATLNTTSGPCINIMSGWKKPPHPWFRKFFSLINWPVRK